MGRTVPALHSQAIKQWVPLRGLFSESDSPFTVSYVYYCGLNSDVSSPGVCCDHTKKSGRSGTCMGKSEKCVFYVYCTVHCDTVTKKVCYIIMSSV
jgi:hypothetical protein